MKSRQQARDNALFNRLIMSNPEVADLVYEFVARQSMAAERAFDDALTAWDRDFLRVNRIKP